MAQVRKCPSCEREIPASARACPGCGAEQVVEKLRLTAMFSVAAPGDGDSDDGARAAGDATARKSSAHPSQTDITQMDLGSIAREAVATAHALQASTRAEPLGAPDVSAVESPVSPSTEVEPAAVAVTVSRGIFAVASWSTLLRAVMVAGGLALLGVFFADASLLGAYGGAQLLLCYHALVGGVLLVGAALMPLPTRIRAVIATGAGAAPLFIAPPLVDLDGWRGLCAALVVLLLPGALLLRARATGSMLARALVGVAVALTLLIYLVPMPGARDQLIVPLAIPLELVRSGSIDHVLVGAITLSPLALAAATLTAFAPRSSTGWGNVWAVLVLGAVSGSVALAGLAQGRGDLVHLGIGLAAAGAGAAVGLAHLLDLGPRTA